MKICLTASHGGHFTQMTRLISAFEGHDFFFITYKSNRFDDIDYNVPMYFLNNLGKNPFSFIKCCPKVIRILHDEKPDIIISTGSEIAIPIFYIGKMLGIKTVFIESLSRVTNPSNTGKLVYPISDLFLVQWEQLLNEYGSKAKYWGNVL